MSQKASFAIYANDSGHYYFAEMRRLLACGLRELGAEAVEADQRGGFVPAARWHVVVAAHEFFFAGAGAKMRRGAWPPSVIFYNTEPLGSRWAPLLRRLLPRAHAVWDMDWTGARRWTREGRRASHVPLGWVDDCELFRTVRVLPDIPLIRALEPGTRRFDAIAEDYSRRPLDLLFVGSRSGRREVFFDEARPVLARHRRFIRLVKDAPFRRPGAAAPLHSRALLGLAQRSKITLNVHREPTDHFEWHRLALHGIGQGSLVLTEAAGEAPPFVAGKDFIAAKLKEMPEAIDYHLSSKQGRAQARKVAAQGFRTYRRSCRLAELLRRAVDGLDAKASPAVEREKARGEIAERMFLEAAR